MLGKKSFLQDHLNNYGIVLRKSGQSRQLDHKERPILMQKKFLQQIGYMEKDRIEDIGREAHSYLFRFVFLPTKLSEYTSRESRSRFQQNAKVQPRGPPRSKLDEIFKGSALSIVSIDYYLGFHYFLTQPAPFLPGSGLSVVFPGRPEAPGFALGVRI